jgi:L-alanine-DL-glutamate epimerase-like enolase superfamily enzyme
MLTGPPALPRRRFLGRAAAALAGCCGLSALPALAGAERPLAGRAASSGLRITRLAAFTVKSERWKVVGKNSHLGVHGKTATDRILLVETDSGLRGAGSCSASREAAAPLLGTDPLSFYHPGAGVVSPLGNGDAPLWDLAGRYYEQPVWRLLGGFGPERVPVYDGSIYFSDLEPEFAARGVERLIEEVEHALAEGHRAFKIKVGRGFKWMEREEGFRRDVEVLRAIRKRVGAGVRLMVDANNGFDLATTKRFLDEVGGDLFFVEEMFPESVEEDLELKRWLGERGRSTLVADGESARAEEHFTPYIAARALDVLQGDIRAFGFTRLLALSRMTAGTGIVLAPHNWGSYLGAFMQVVLARGIPNFLIGEVDPGRTDLFAGAERFELREGTVLAPDAPGLGLEFREDAFLARGGAPDWVIDAR